MRRFRRLTLVVPVLLLVLLAGGVCEKRLRANSRSADELNELLRVYAEVLDVAEQNYADEIDVEKTVYDSIRGMLTTLDPHSNFFDPKTFSQLREDQQGNYYGLGITIGIRNAKPTVISPIPGTPAYRLGIRSGDIIAKIEGKPTDGYSVQDVVDKLRGPKGTAVNISIQREGMADLFEFSVVRDEIPHHSIPFAFFVRPKVGYIRIDSFTETTEDELGESLRKLGPNLEGLLLDLRNNPGGALNAAIGVADKFLRKDQDVLVTRGRIAAANHVYPATLGTQGPLYPMVVLINAGSASASEIVAGAIQDHDRGLIVGETSFGKGLVQTAFPLSHGAGLALTTGRWYTPSGRLIQRDYSHKSYYEYYNNVGQKPAAAEIKHTDSGREVFGGGGINPDVRVSIPPLNSFQTVLLSRSAFFLYVRSYIANHMGTEEPLKVDDTLLAAFRKFLDTNQIPYQESEFSSELDFIKRELVSEYDLAKLGPEEAHRVHLDGDAQVIKALDTLPQAKALLQQANRQMARGDSSGAP